MNNKWDGFIDFVQNSLIFILILVIAVCILTLIAFDGVVGTGSMLFLTNGNLKASIGISLATSGLLLSLMFVGYNAIKGKKSGGVKTFGYIVLVVAGAIYCLDVYFDSLTADYLRFGKFVALESLAPDVMNVQILFRALVGGISTVGESLAIAIILGMPVLKDIVQEALPKAKKENFGHQEHNKPKFDKSHYVPKHRPEFNFGDAEKFRRENN